MAPASRARSTSSRCENAVRMTTGARCLAAICSAAEIPSSTGILTSRIIRSGRRLDASSTACSPSDAWPAISYPSSSSISFRSSRISASSSAITTRTGVGLTATSVPKAVDWPRSRLSLPAEMASQAPVDQSAESAVSNTVQCGFESHPGHPPGAPTRGTPPGAPCAKGTRGTVAHRTATELFELEEAERVVVGVGEPGSEREPNVGYAAGGAELGQVLDVDAARPELGNLGGEVGHPPAGLGRRVGGAGRAFGDDQPAVTPASEGEELLGLEQHFQSQRAGVELAGHGEVGRKQHHIDWVITQHGSTSLVKYWLGHRCGPG